jgi:hypothetical protein
VIAAKEMLIRSRKPMPKSRNRNGRRRRETLESGEVREERGTPVVPDAPLSSLLSPLF